MSKRVFIAVLFLVIALAMSIFSYRYIEKTSLEMLDIIDILIDSEKRNINFSRQKEELLSKWDKNKTRFGMLLKHNDFDVLEKNFIFLSHACLTDDKDNIVEKLKELKAGLIIALSGEKPVLENIF